MSPRDTCDPRGRSESARGLRLGPASPALLHFVRDVLGCGCDSEVFRRVEEDSRPLAGLPELAGRIRVGGRLLIYLIEPRDNLSAESGLADWVAEGRTERDRLGMNRLRLALYLPKWEPEACVRIEEAFAVLAEQDERVFLHLLTGDSSPWPKSVGN